MYSAAKMDSLQSVNIQSAQDSVVAAIRDAIFRGELKLGQRLLEKDLSAKFQISRATVREALRRLEHVGLIQIRARRGTFVTQLTRGDIERTCRLRAVLEGLAARYASETMTQEDHSCLEAQVQAMKRAVEDSDPARFLQLDREFHEVIWTFSGDVQLQYILRFLSTPYFAFVATLSTFVLTDIRRVWRAHEEYVETLRDKRPDFVQRKVQEIHERLAVSVLKDIRRFQKKDSPGPSTF